MIGWALLSIGTIFVVITLIRKFLKNRLNVKPCAVCGAVSLTWIALIILRSFGYQISDVLIGVLMGQSVTGIMYLFENNAKKKNRKNLLWLKIAIILLGTFVAYNVALSKFDFAFWVSLGLAVVLALILISLLKGKKSDAIVEKKYGKFKGEIKKLEEKFEHCCD